MSRLDDLKYALASAGYSPERIAFTEREIFALSVELRMSVERVSSDFLAAFYAMQSFSDGMAQVVAAANMAEVSVIALASSIQTLMEWEDADIPTPAPQPTQKTPYYQKNKRQWWK